MLKLIGLLGLVIACGLSGIMKAGDLKKRVALLEDYLQMIIELKGQINYFREPLPDIFDKLKKTIVLPPISFLTVSARSSGKKAVKSLKYGLRRWKKYISLSRSLQTIWK